LGKSDHLASNQRSSCQIERCCGLALTDLLGAPFVSMHINAFEFEVQSIQDLLLRLTFMAGEHRAQRLMPRNDPIECLFQLTDIQLATDGDSTWNVVAGAVGFELVDEPQSFLSKAQRQPLESGAVDRSNGGRLAFFGFGD